MSSTTIGVIGLGRMGGPIAARLAREGHDVVGFDAAGSEERSGQGVRVASSVADVAGRCRVVALSLPDGAASEGVITELVQPGDRAVTTVIDLSTIGMSASKRCAAILAAAKIDYVDAPVSGGVAGASTGQMAMMAAASPTVLRQVEPLLSEIAKNLYVVGEEPGHGQAMKLLNNFVSANALAATFEAVVFGSRVGLDMQQMVDVLNASSGRTTASSDKLPRAVLPGTYDFGFAAEAMRKDVRLYLEGATRQGAPHEVAKTVDALWQRFVDAYPGTDFTYLHRYLEEGGS
jgi:3-hydroxyisobutyrate dehydrogenase